MAKRKVLAGDPALAVAYIRRSTNKQELTPAAQGAQLDAWAAREGVQLVATFFDLGVSGTTGLSERPGLVGALAALQPLGVGVLAAAKRCRVARNIEVIRTVAREAVKVGAVMRTADGTNDEDDSDSAHMRNGIEDLFNETEVRRTRARTRAALAVKKARGERVGTVPYGFAVAADGVRLVPDEPEQKVISRIAELRGAGESERDIVSILAGEGITGRANKPLAQPQVHRLVVRLRAIGSASAAA